MLLVVQYVQRTSRLYCLAIGLAVGASHGQAQGKIVQIGIEDVHQEMLCEFFLYFMRTLTFEEADGVTPRIVDSLVRVPVRNGACNRQGNMPRVTPPNPRPFLLGFNPGLMRPIVLYQWRGIGVLERKPSTNSNPTKA